MPPKTSAEMKEALHLVQQGLTGRAAAKQAGVREESLYRHPLYKAAKIDAGLNIESKLVGLSPDALLVANVFDGLNAENKKIARKYLVKLSMEQAKKP